MRQVLLVCAFFALLLVPGIAGAAAEIPGAARAEIQVAPIRPDGQEETTGISQPIRDRSGERGTLIENLTTLETFDSIQDAIDDTDTVDGHVLQFMAGVTSHALTAQVRVDKAVTILGVSGGTTTLTPGADVFNVAGSAGTMILVVEVAPKNGRGAHFENLVVDGAYPTYQVYAGIRAQRDLSGTVPTTVTACTIKNIREDTYLGFGIIAYSSMTVTDCVLENIGRVGIWAGDGNTLETTLIAEGNTYTGKGPGTHIDYAIELGMGAAGTLTNNTISDCRGVAGDGSISAGVLATTYYGPGTAGTLTGNTISDNSYGMVVGYGASDSTVVVANGNDFSGNDENALDSVSAIAVDATGNWWGDLDPSDDVGGDVDYSPWWGANYVGDPHALAWTWHTDDSIQEAVDACSDGDIVRVAAGTYEEQITLDARSVSILGAGAGTTIIQSPAALATTFMTSVTNKCIFGAINGAALTLEDVTVDGRGYGNANYRFIGVGFYNAGGTVTACEVKEIRDTPISGAQHGVGIYGYVDNGLDRTVTVSGCDVYGYQKNAMAFNGAHLTAHVDGCTVTGAGSVTFIAQNGIQIGIGATGSIGTNSPNTISGHAYTPHTWAASGILLISTSGSVEIRNNVLSGNSESIYCSNASAEITGNTITQTQAGLGFGDYAGIICCDPGESGPIAPAAPFDVPARDGWRTAKTYVVDDNILDGDDGANSVGLWVWCSNGSTLTFSGSGNAVTDYDYGVLLQEQSAGLITSAVLELNSIHSNASYGLYNDAALSVDAENNWWGASDGPGAPGGGGSGDPVAGVVDFTPWLGGNIICVPDPQEISAADLNHRDEVVLRYLGGGSAPLYGYSLDVEWTVSLATLHSATRPDTGPFAGAAAFQVVNLGPGHVRIDAAIGGAHPGTNGPDDLCKLTFEGIGCGQTALNVTIRRLRDTGNQNITGVTADDGELAVDLVDPTVTAVQIVRTNLPETGYVKNHDDLEVRATVGDACGALDDLTITADLSGLLSGGGGAVPPTSFDPISGLAIWDLADVTLTTPDGGKSVTVTAVDLLGNSGDAGGSTYADNTRPGSISALTAMPGHNEIELTWTNPTGDPDLDNYGIMIRRAEWDGSSPPSQDDYPEYTGTAPSYPDSAAGERIYRQSGMIAGHVDGFAGDGSERDIYYYQAFVFDKAYNYGPAASGARDRATNYWLGDVSPNSWPTGIGNGLVNTGDISALGATYYVAPGGGSWNPHCDVGPTDDGGAFDIPQPDDQVEFEDLMVFSMNFGEVSPFVAPPAGTPDVPTTGPVALAIELPAEFNVGGEFVARIHLDDELGVVQGTHFTVSYDAAVLEYLGATPGALVERTVDAFFMPLVIKDLPDLSIAALGRGATFGGSGILAELRFRVLAPGAIRLGMPEATARSIRNQELLPQAPSDVTADELPLAVVPSRVYLQANQPNPFSQATTLRFGLPAAGAVRLAVFDVSGRSVRTLVNGVLPAAEHVFSWDRRDDSGHAVAAGVYLYRLETEGQTITRKLVVSE